MRRSEAIIRLECALESAVGLMQRWASINENFVLHCNISVNKNDNTSTSYMQQTKMGGVQERKNIPPVTFVSREMEMQFPSNFTCLAGIFGCSLMPKYNTDWNGSEFKYDRWWGGGVELLFFFVFRSPLAVVKSSQLFKFSVFGTTFIDQIGWIILFESKILFTCLTRSSSVPFP